MTNPTPTLTAAQLITKLQKLNPNTPITHHHWDPEWDHSNLWGINNITETGEIQYGEILDSWQGINKGEYNEIEDGDDDDADETPRTTQNTHR